MQESRWTLDELAERVDVALAVDYTGQPSGRVRAVPDRRAIRWYTTIGLVDRPVAHRGRTALYGPRHLLQLVAVKRLQASGLPLVAIQQELAGASDTQLARVARLPASPAALDGAGSPPAEGPTLAAAGAPRAAAANAPQAASGAARAVAGRPRRTEFWREQAASFVADPLDRADPGAQVGVPDPGLPVATLQGIRLGEGVTLLLEPGREVASADLEAILDAARPLLAVLRERGLGRSAVHPPAEPDPDPALGPRPAGRHEPPQGPGPRPARGRERRREHP
jgi:DNA-binding transcriptional MerR regulator